MKALLLILFGFTAGFAGTVLFRAGPSIDRKGSPAPVPPAQIALRTAPVPADFKREVEQKLSAARAAAADRELARNLQQEIDRWMRADPLECLHWLSERRALGFIQREDFSALFAGAFRGNLSLAIREALQFPDARLRSDWLSAAFEEAAETSPAQAFELLAYLPAHLRSFIGRKIVTELAKADPAAAWEAITTSRASWHKEGSQRWQSHSTWASDVAQIWAAQDPQGFLRFARNRIEQGKVSRENTLLAQALQDVAMSPQAGLVLDLLGGTERTEVTENLWRVALGHASTFDLPRAMQSVLSEPEGVSRSTAIRNVALGIASADPDRALQMIESLPDSAQRFTTLTKILGQQARINPAAATATAAALENPVARTEAMRTVAENWLQKNPAEMTQFSLDSAQSPEGGAWLDLITEMLRKGQTVHHEGPWLTRLAPPTRDRLAEALRTRIPASDWQKIEGHFARKQP